MKTNCSTTRWFGVTALVSAIGLPCSLHAQSRDNVATAMSTQWQAYVTAELEAAAGLKPTLVSKASRGLAQALHDALTREINASLQLTPDSALRLQLRDGFAGAGFGSNKLVGIANGLAEQKTIAPTLVRQVAPGLKVALGGVFTYESFSSRALGIKADARDAGMESSSGSAVFLGMETERWNGLAFNVSGRSKTRMDAFRSFRGVFAEPGRFDLPGSFGAGLNYAVSPQLNFDAQASRLNYSEVKPFTSELLPERFVALLGDSNSPVFQWSNLNVFRAGVNFLPAPNQSLSVSWSTSQQPKPTSARLRRALRDEFSNQNFALSYGLGLSKAASVRLSASYAESNYFFGPSLLLAKDYEPGQQFEGEAVFEFRF